MNPHRSGLVAAVALAFCAGCTSSSATGGSDTFPAAPLMAIGSKSGALRVEVRSAPTQPPELGDGSWSFTITDESSGEPVSGLSLGVVPWMPAMGHGTSTVPSVRDADAGVYIIDDVVLFMPGQWDLRTKISGSTEDDVVVSVDIP